jgi:hypothetical protein
VVTVVARKVGLVMVTADRIVVPTMVPATATVDLRVIVAVTVTMTIRFRSIGSTS